MSRESRKRQRAAVEQRNKADRIQQEKEQRERSHELDRGCARANRRVAEVGVIAKTGAFLRPISPIFHQSFYV